MPNILPTYIPEGFQSEVVDVDDSTLRMVTIGKSLRLWWEQGVPCPCRAVRTLGARTQSTGEPSDICAFCDGGGIMYVNGQQIVAMMTSTSESQNLYMDYGQFAKGTAWLTLMPENVADYLDRYTLLDGIRTHGELRRRKGTVDKLRYPVVQRQFVSGSLYSTSQPFNRSIGVQFCMAADTDGVVTGVELVAGTDFTITAQGRVDWTLGDLAGTAPAVGGYYTIRYYARPRMILDDHTYLRRDLYAHENGNLCLTPMPVRALVILDFLGGSPPAVDDNPQPTSEIR